MKKASLVLTLVALVALFGRPAFAGPLSDQIVMNSQTSLGGFTFSGTAGQAFSTLSFNTIKGGAYGQGALTITNANNGTNSGFYTISSNGSNTITNGGSGCSGTCTLLNQSNPTGILLSLGSSAGGNDLLWGYLTLQDVAQSGKTGTINNNLVVNLSIQGGSMAGLFAGSNGIVQLLLAINSGTHSIYNLPSTGKIGAPLHGGTINPTLPEPGSLALLGTGLIGLGGLARLKFRLRA